MNPPEELDTTFKVRPYQIELLEKAIKKNIIVYLKTGSGKTFISVMLIKELSDQIQLPYSKGGKRTIFLANTVPLVKQQAKYIKEHTHMKVEDYYGSKVIDNKILDSWDKTIWDKQLEQAQVLVMSPQILVDMIQHSFIDILKINLIIFDECHHATGNHPYSQIILKCKENNISEENMRILGLTASIVNKKCNLETFNNHMKKLEDKFGCKIETSSLLQDMENEKEGKFHKKPKIVLTNFTNDYEKSLSLSLLLNHFKKDFEKFDNKLTEELRNKKKTILEKLEKNEAELDQMNDYSSDNVYKIFKKEFADLEVILEELGIWSFSVAWQETIKNLKRKCSSVNVSLKTLFESIENILGSELKIIIPEEDQNKPEKILSYSSNKVNCLLDIYLKQSRNDNFHSIVFVDRKTTAYYLDYLIQQLNKLEEWEFIKSGYIFGSSNDGTSTLMSTLKQENVLEKFRRFQTNLLVSTNIVEEGIDIPACNMIVRFGKIQNFGSYIQSKGRARSKNSKYYILNCSNDSNDFVQDLANFIKIEDDIELKLKKQENDDEPIFSLDEIEYLNTILIRPYIKDKSQITCHTAISLINRYCSNLEQNSCAILYPIYSIQTHEDLHEVSFSCSLRLPPNPVLNVTIQSDKFARKKWAKMDAALKMCIELDKAGELTENLTIKSKEEWLTAHYVEDEEQYTKDGKKIGTNKNKREYKATICDEFLNKQVQNKQEFYLYLIDINEKLIDTDKEFIKLINDDTKLCFLSYNNFDSVCKFNLYKSSNQFECSIRNMRKNIFLDENQIDLLKKFHLLIFSSLLKIRFDFNFDNSVYGCFIAPIKLQNEEILIDWEYLSSLEYEKTLYHIYLDNKDKNLDNFKNYLCKFNNKTMLIKSIDLNVLASSAFPNENVQANNFVDYFKNKYKVDTLDINQPMVEIENVIMNRSFILKSNSKISKQETSKSNYKIYYIMEHLTFIPLKISQIFIYTMLPSIFYRTDCIFRSHKLQQLIQNHLKTSLNLNNPITSEADWDNSLKYHKMNDNQEENLNRRINENEEDYDDEPTDLLVFYNEEKNEEDKNSNLENDIPNLAIIDGIKPDVSFPNVLNILQCLTLKSACDDFDLERYELIGDCFLKLSVIMKIYTTFDRTNEGKLASLKSMRVSNKYLYKLAIEKNLNEYIVNQKFDYRENWIGPYFDKDKLEQNERNKIKLSDKSLADCIEALIGVYLIKMGTDAAQSFIEWLNFKISDQMGKVDFTQKLDLPDPCMAKMNVNNDYLDKLTLEFSSFEESLGYVFRNKFYLLQAFTHSSDITNRYTASYQRLEFVGDAVIDVLITQYIYNDQKEYSPGELTDLRQALVNNKFFAHLAVKHDFAKYFRYGSKEIFDKLNSYLKMHKLYPPDVAYLGLKTENSEFETDDYEIEAPKFLADIYESVAGAIYLDSGCNLETVWRIYYKMFRPYLMAFKNNVPVSPIKALTNLKPKIKLKPVYTETENPDNEEEPFIQASLEIENQTFVGIGANNTIAKTIAFKKAVRTFLKDKRIIFF